MQVKDATGDRTRLLVVGDSQRGEYAPLVALWLRVTQIVFHHADEGAAQVLVWDVFRTDPGEIGGRLEQAIAHAPGAGGERVHRVSQFLKGVEGLGHCPLLRSARWRAPAPPWRFAWHALHRC